MDHALILVATYMQLQTVLWYSHTNGITSITQFFKTTQIIYSLRVSPHTPTKNEKFWLRA